MKTKRTYLQLTYTIVFAAVIILAANVKQAYSSSAKRLPNVIIIFTDDQGYQDVGCFGSPLIKTPNLDQMAKEGMRFTDFYSASPVCSPSRAALLTGCYPLRVGIDDVFIPASTYGLNPKEITIADLLKSRGYATACVGKWHLGHQSELLPTQHGFDSFYGIPYSNDMDLDPRIPLSNKVIFREGMTAERYKKEEPKQNWVPLMQNEKVIEYPCDQTTITKRYTDKAIEFITKNKETPFFLYLPHTMPHVPLFTTDRFKGKSKAGAYGDTIEEIDWSVGEILKTLKQLKLDENTLVVFTSDNGPWLEYGKEGGIALPLRDGKFTTYEGGMRVPCIMRWPNQIPKGKVCSELTSTIDLLPTIAAIVGEKMPQDRTIDGQNILTLLKDPQTQTPHSAFYYSNEQGKIEAVRMGNWKYRFAKPEYIEEDNKPEIELFNLQDDISEKNNVAIKYPARVKQMQNRLNTFEKELIANKREPGGIQ